MGSETPSADRCQPIRRPSGLGGPPARALALGRSEWFTVGLLALVLWTAAWAFRASLAPTAKGYLAAPDVGGGRTSAPGVFLVPWVPRLHCLHPNAHVGIAGSS